jgi:hypothetical protein
MIPLQIAIFDPVTKSLYFTTAGYDLATGLGSVDATNMFNAWPQF